MKLCLRGHDKDVVGVYASGFCKACCSMLYRERRIEHVRNYNASYYQRHREELKAAQRANYQRKKNAKQESSLGS